MAGSLNEVQLIGNLGDDPEIKHLDGGRMVANFSIATSESWKDKQTGEKQERTEWHRVVCWNEGLINIIEQYVRKGSKVYVKGQLQTRKWKDKDDNDRYSTEVVMTGFDTKLLLLGDSRGGRASDPNGNASRPGNSAGSGDNEYAKATGKSQPRGNGGGQGRVGGGGRRDMDDEIPF